MGRTAGTTANRRRPGLPLRAVAIGMLASGCAPSVPSELLGAWVGRPDTQQARAASENLRYGPSLRGAATEPSGEAPSGGVGADDRVTDWERYDATVRLRFLDRQRMTLQLDDRPPVAARWRLVETGPAGAVLEVDVDPPPASPSSAAAGESRPARRQFELAFDRDAGRLVGFALTEAAADRQLGALYFQRDQ